jgi:hypothetical protein
MVEKRSTSNTLGTLASMATIFTAVVTLIALVPAFGQWLFPKEGPTGTTPEPALTVAPMTSEYSTIALEQYSRRDRPESSDTLLGLDAGIHYLSMDRIPFDLGWTASTNCAVLPDDPTSLQIEVNHTNVTHVFILLQAGNGLAAFRNKEIGTVQLDFLSNERSTQWTTKLIMSVNIRDWSREINGFVNTIEEGKAQSIWEGSTPGGVKGGIDMLVIEVPKAYQDMTLTKIHLHDTSIEHVGSLDPCIHVPAITVKYLK